VNTVLNEISLSNALDAVVPITRFNRGEANKIFDEVRESGCKVVVKNNVPACVMLAPERFKEMVDMIEDQALLTVAESRMEYNSDKVIAFKDILTEDGLSFAEIDAMEDVEIE
jgi:PHD/YefM family antitoxin component YafN of YafNO toxin-antitoxin module